MLLWRRRIIDDLGLTENGLGCRVRALRNVARDPLVVSIDGRNGH
jgi:hypothetical protein